MAEYISTMELCFTGEYADYVIWQSGQEPSDILCGFDPLGYRNRANFSLKATFRAAIGYHLLTTWTKVPSGGIPTPA